MFPRISELLADDDVCEREYLDPFAYDDEAEATLVPEEVLEVTYPQKAIVIVSGGMDSVTLAHYVAKEVRLEPTLLSFDYGQKHVRELDCAEQCAYDLQVDWTVIDLTALAPSFNGSALVEQSIVVPEIIDVMGDPQPPTYVPNRNMIMLSIAAACAESQNARYIYYGAQKHDLYGYWDTTFDFVARMNEVLSLNRKHLLEVVAPFVTLSKAGVLRLGLELGVNYSKTWSCYKGEAVACGTCPTCAERLKAFEEVGMPDPIQYAYSNKKRGSRCVECLE